MGPVPVELVSLPKGDNRYGDIFIDRRPSEDTQKMPCEDGTERMHLQAKERWELLETTRSWKGQRRILP